jgi:hypothetical protein
MNGISWYSDVYMTTNRGFDLHYLGIHGNCEQYDSGNSTNYTGIKSTNCGASDTGPKQITWAMKI